jgi:hypothetical protein
VAQTSISDVGGVLIPQGGTGISPCRDSATLRRQSPALLRLVSQPFAFLSGRKYAVGMTLEGIKQAIAELPEGEMTSLVAWLNERDAKAWDKQIEDDFSEGGVGMAMLEKWDAEIKTGKSIPLEEFLAQREKAQKAE